MAVDMSLFQVREKDGLKLYVPGYEGNAPWTPETIKYRSRIEDADGKLVSTGFRKFFNLGTGPDGLRVTDADVREQCGKGVIATLKMDGSLLIRSVYKGQVMWRTRGSFGVDHCPNLDEMNQFYKDHPRLFDPNIYNGFSLLFEWVSPFNIIVLKYPKPALTLIGAVTNHGAENYMHMNAVRHTSRVLNVPVVPSYYLNTVKEWDTLLETLTHTQTIEGYVIRIHNEQTLVKVKAEPYLTKHGLKSLLTTEKLVDMYLQAGRPSYKEFVKQFVEAFDEETFLWARGLISSLYDGVSTVESIEAHMKIKADLRKDLPRKEAAILGIREYGKTKKFSAYMNLWQGQEIDQPLLRSLLLQNTKQGELGMDLRPSEADIEFEKDPHHAS